MKGDGDALRYVVPLVLAIGTKVIPIGAVTDSRVVVKDTVEEDVIQVAN